MAKQKPAGAIDKDLPWWFEIYHIAWLVVPASIWYFFGLAAMLGFFFLAAAYFSVFN